MGERGKIDSSRDATLPASDQTPHFDTPETAPGSGPGAFGPGATIGRYLIKEVVGVGGSGLVLAALDSELGRKVAIKVLTHEQEEGRIRLMREAQAMARLSHPNVVTVHEVLRVGDRAGIVMELVDGVDLQSWQRQARRSWREIVGAYIQAARGLAAAHRIGLVHRDFKPSNALIDGDGVVRVTDFGLVRAAGAPDESASPASLGEPSSAERPALDVELTRPGVVLGTPAYMAPEQHAGEPVDARTDQWALACSLYHALYDQRPFPGYTLSEIATSVLAGELREEPRTSKVPRAIRAAIRRGLAREPAERFATMEELIAALTPHRRGGLALAAVGVVAVGAASAVILTRPEPQSTACRGLDAPVTAVWNPARASELTRRFETVGGPAAGAVAGVVTTALDGRARQWVDARTRTCVQARQGVISAELLDRRVRCLDQRLVEVDTVVTEWIAIERRGIDQAPDVVERLHAIADCDTPSDVIPLPTDPAVRADLTSGEQILARAWALAELGFWDRSRPLATEAVAIGDRSGWAPFQTRALMQLSKALSHEKQGTAALELIDRAATAAARAGDDLHVAESLISRFWVLAVDLGRPDEALADSRFIELALERARNPPRQVAHWHHHRAAAYYYLQRFDEAVEAQRAALAIFRELFPPGHVEITDSINNMAVYQTSRGEYAEAAELIEQSLRNDLLKRGPDHPDVAMNYLNLGNLEQVRGDLVAAMASFHKARDIYERAGRPAWDTWMSLGIGEHQLGRWRASVASLTRAVADAEQEAPGVSLQVGYATVELGVALTAMGELDRAGALLAKGIEVARAAKSPGLSEALGALALHALARGDVAGAREAVAAAGGGSGDDSLRLAAAEAELARRDGDCARARTKLDVMTASARKLALELSITDAAVGRAECALVEGKARDAVSELEARIARMEALGAEAPALASARFALARVLVASKGDRARARALADAARGGWTGLGETGKARAAEITRWLAAH